MGRGLEVHVEGGEVGQGGEGIGRGDVVGGEELGRHPAGLPLRSLIGATPAAEEYRGEREKWIKCANALV